MPFPEPHPAPSPLPAVPAPVAFSVGGVLSRSFTVWFRNFVPFSAVTLLVYAPVFAVAIAAPADGGPGWSFLDRVVSGLADLAVTGALTWGVLQSLHGRRVGVGNLLRTGLRKMGWVFLVSFAVGLWLLLGVLLLVIPAIVWYCGLYVAVPAVVVEADLGVNEALRRSRSLTAGHRWAILAVVVVVFLVTMLGLFAASLIAGVAFAGIGTGEVPHVVEASILTAVLAASSTLGACASAVAYHDLRVAKEGVSTADLVKVFE